MQLIDLIKLASKGYEKEFPESPLTEQCHKDGTPLSLREYQRKSAGDTLGRWVVIELNESYNPDATDDEQIAEAIRVIINGRDDLDNIIAELMDHDSDSSEITEEYWTLKNVLNKQKLEPVFLTSGCCESTMGNDLGYDVFSALNLQFGAFDHATGQQKDCPNGLSDVAANDSFYPLTVSESKYIAEDWIPGHYGGTNLAYSFLYQGKKYIGPSVDICFWLGDGSPFSRPSYGKQRDSLFDSKELAMQQAICLRDFLKPKLEALGGICTIIEAEVDRHTVAMLIPVDTLVEMNLDFPGYQKFVAKFFEGYQPPIDTRNDIELLKTIKEFK